MKYNDHDLCIMEICTCMCVCVCVCVCVCLTQVAHTLQDQPFTFLGASGTALPLFVPLFQVPGMK